MAERQDASADPWQAAPADVVLGDDEAHVWRVGLRDGAAALAPLLSPDERVRVARLVEPRDRTRFTVARASLRRILARYVGDAAEELRFVYGPHGKPALAGAAARGSGVGEVQFNLSHADDLACVAVTRAGAVGVDVERLRAVTRRDELVARFFSARDRAALAGWAPARRDHGFLRCWTLKEAYVKALGSGVSHPLDAFDIAFDEDAPPRLLAERVGEPAAWSLSRFLPAVGYVGALAVRATVAGVAFFRLDAP